MRSASRASERGLDWFTFFVADIQTGFGPFLAIYLTTQKWNQADIGLALAAGSVAGPVSQLPGGWLVERSRKGLRRSSYPAGRPAQDATLFRNMQSRIGHALCMATA